MKMTDQLACMLFSATLRLYPRAFREAFGPQMLADFEDARQEQAKDWTFVWTISMLWDMVRGAAWSHTHPLPVPSVQMAVAGGGQLDPHATLGELDFKKMKNIMGKQLPASMKMLMYTMVGGGLVGFGVYDPKSLMLFGGVGMFLVARGVFWARPTWDFFKKQPECWEEAHAKNLSLIVVVGVVMFVLNAGFYSLNTILNHLNTNLNTNLMVGPLFGVKAHFLTGLVVMTLGISTLPLMFVNRGPSVQKSDLMLLLLPLTAAVGGVVVGVMKNTGTFFVVVHSIMVGVVLVQTFKPRITCSWTTEWMMWLLPLPIFLGFALALSVDYGMSRSTIDSVGIFHPDIGSAYDFSNKQMEAIGRLRQDGDENKFWREMDQLRQERKVMHSTRLWMWMADVQPVGLPALRLCRAMAPHRGYDGLQCAQMPDANTWISTPEQARAMRVPK